jgi:hypothetical protein
MLHGDTAMRVTFDTLALQQVKASTLGLAEFVHRALMDAKDSRSHGGKVIRENSKKGFFPQAALVLKAAASWWVRRTLRKKPKVRMIPGARSNAFGSQYRCCGVWDANQFCSRPENEKSNKTPGLSWRAQSKPQESLKNWSCFGENSPGAIHDGVVSRQNCKPFGHQSGSH